METFHKTWAAVLALVFSTPTFAQSDGLDLARQVSENYHNLRSFEFAGHLTVSIPGTEFQMQVNTINAEAGHSFVPEHSAVLRYGEALSFGAVKLADAEGKPAPPDLLKTGVMMPNHWGYYEQMAVGIEHVKEFPPQTLDMDGVPVKCRVLEIAYDRARWKPEESTVRFWVDANRLLVVKEEFSELQGRHDNATLWHWTYTVDSVTLNQSPPQWLVEVATNNSDEPKPRPEWIGREAPDFTLHDLDGRQVQLSTMRDRIVLLEFWATWCGPCRAEMPTVEKVADDYKARALETWGISDEKPATVKEWLARNQRNLRVLTDPEGKVSEQFQVEGIPTLLVIGRDGKILSYYTGTQSEQSLRSVIDSALSENPRKKR